MSTKNDKKIGSIGDRIKAFRIKNKLTLVQLSNIIGISHGSLSGLENDKSKPSAETLSNFCLHTDVDIKWLLTGENTNKLEEPSKSRKFRILDELEEWLSGEIKADPGREIWFEIQAKDSFTSFKAWKEEKEGKTEAVGSWPASKVA